MVSFGLASAVGLGAVVGWAALRRGRQYALFLAVMVGLHTLLSAALAPRFGVLTPLAYYLQATVYVHFLRLATPAPRPAWYRFAVSLPAHWFSAGTLLALPWALLAAFGVRAPLWWLPYLLAGVGLLDSFRRRMERVDVWLGNAPTEGLKRLWKRKGAPTERPLRLVQITDPHLGPFMSSAQLRKLCEDAVREAPDLVLLTGDFLTMESHGAREALAHALEPLRALEGRTFACLGNHDHEALATVRHGLASAGVKLLVDELARVETPIGPVELLGFDFVWRGRDEHMRSVVDAHPRTEGVLRLALLHDPGAFKHLPEGAADLTLSGHTHGGQLGLLWLGLPQTFVSAVTSVPDHGLWGRGSNLLYVHRGSAHYGFPVRLGVPPEHSVLHLHASTQA